MMELLDLRVHEEVSSNYFGFGIFLLNDTTGSRVSGFEQACQRDPERIVQRILREWVEGKGLPVTWESIIQTLNKTGMSTLAHKIEASKLPVPCLPHLSQLIDEQPPTKKQKICEQ